MRIIVVSLLLLTTSCIIGFSFWKQELQYALPTPVPAGYRSVVPGTLVTLPGITQRVGRPLYIHFFNPDCPCSRFNLKQFQSLRSDFEKQVDVYAVIPEFASVDEAREMIGDKHVRIIQDQYDDIADRCGVYSTPQAVLIDATGALYYRGNYNRARYCVDPQTNYAARALNALIKGEPCPQFDILATQSYGCELPDSSIVTSLF